LLLCVGLVVLTRASGVLDQKTSIVRDEELRLLPSVDNRVSGRCRQGGTPNQALFATEVPRGTVS
jgi:hypothetical protein